MGNVGLEVCENKRLRVFKSLNSCLADPLGRSTYSAYRSVVMQVACTAGALLLAPRRDKAKEEDSSSRMAGAGVPGVAALALLIQKSQVHAIGQWPALTLQADASATGTAHLGGAYSGQTSFSLQCMAAGKDEEKKKKKKHKEAAVASKLLQVLFQQPAHQIHVQGKHKKEGNEASSTSKACSNKTSNPCRSSWTSPKMETGT